MPHINFDIHALTLENLGDWPDLVKYAVVGLSCFLILLLGYGSGVNGVFVQLREQQKIEKELRLQLEFKQQKIIYFSAHQIQRAPLEKFSLDALKMVGVLSYGNERWALILTPEGKIYKAKVGNYIGRNLGRISSITDDQVNIIEQGERGGGSVVLKFPLSEDKR